MKYVSLYQDMMTYDMYEEIVKMVAGKKKSVLSGKDSSKNNKNVGGYLVSSSTCKESMEGISLIFTTEKLN